jgi:hypothetical protein
LGLTVLPGGKKDNRLFIILIDWVPGGIPERTFLPFDRELQPETPTSSAYFLADFFRSYGTTISYLLTLR